MPFKKIIVFVVSILTLGLPANADWANPTNANDCAVSSWPIYQQKIAAQGRARSCFRENYGTRGNGPREYERVCVDQYNQWRREIPSCSGLEKNVCQLSNEINRRKETCNARLSEYRERENALKEQQKELQRIRNEQERIARESARNQAVSDTVTSYVQDRYQSLPAGPARLVSDTQLTGHGLARLAGVGMMRRNNAYYLSSSMVLVGNRVIGGMVDMGLNELEGSLQEFNASNPRPTAAQLDAYHEGRATLAGEYAQHMTRVQNTDYDLPLNDKSAVVGSYAGVITQLVEMRNSGEIDTPIATVGAAVATVLAVRAYREAEERASEEPGRDRPQPVSASELREMRQAALAPVRQERARIEAERRRQQQQQVAARKQVEEERRKAEQLRLGRLEAERRALEAQAQTWQPSGMTNPVPLNPPRNNQNAVNAGRALGVILGVGAAIASGGGKNDGSSGLGTCATDLSGSDCHGFEMDNTRIRNRR